MIPAILGDDTNAVAPQLESDPALASIRFCEPKLHRHKIFHWIYAGDTLTHLAAAGHRVEIVPLLLRAGADPNAAHNHRGSTPTS